MANLPMKASLFGIPLVVAFAAAKSAMIGLIRTMATELSPHDVGWAAVYLTSSAAKFVTGSILPVDGGVSMGI